MARTRDLWKNPARRGHGKRWLAVWTEPGGRERTMAFAKKGDADRHGTAMEADTLRGAYINPKRGNVTLRDYGEEKYLPAQFHLRPNSATTYASHLRNHIYPALGSRRMGSLERRYMKSFVALLAAKLAPSTTETVFTVLRALMQSAVDDKVIAANPCSRVPLPQAGKRVIEPMPAAAVQALSAAITPRYELAVWLGGAAGLREGEALGLTVPRADFLHRRIHVLEQMQNRALSPLKTRASRRVVPADDILLNAISAHMQRWAPSGMLWRSRAGTEMPGKRAGAGQSVGGGRVGL